MIKVIVRCDVCGWTCDHAMDTWHDPRSSMQRDGWVFDDYGERCRQHAAPPKDDDEATR